MFFYYYFLFKEFKPERFEDEAKLSRDPYSYFPFSAGSR